MSDTSCHVGATFQFLCASVTPPLARYRALVAVPRETPWTVVVGLGYFENHASARPSHPLPTRSPLCWKTGAAVREA